MSGLSDEPWSDNVNAPQIPFWQYQSEKAFLAGDFIGMILYGIVIVLFFQCMGTLLNPPDRARGGVKWGLAAHTAAMFLFVTISSAASFDLYSIALVDNREFPGLSIFAPGPFGYLDYINTAAVSVVPNVMFVLNTCLADGFLIYRCYVIYSMSYWVTVLPCLMYLASLGLGILLTYYQISPAAALAWNSIVQNLALPYYAITLSLNVLLTLMIAVRLIRHSRNIRKAVGPAASGGLYNTVVTMLVESCSLYAVCSILVIGPIGANSGVSGIFLPMLTYVQVIAPFLILRRVANKTSLTSEAVTTGRVGSIRFQSRGGSTAGDGTFSDADEDPVSPTGSNGETSGQLGAGAENITDQVAL